MLSKLAAQHLAGKAAAAGVVASGHVAEGVSAGETHSRAHRLLAQAAQEATADLAEQATEELATCLFEILRSQADAEGGEKVLDMPAVEFETVGLSDADRRA
jgi:hypothetical protein